jgi:hypothetical protein
MLLTSLIVFLVLLAFTLVAFTFVALAIDHAIDLIIDLVFILFALLVLLVLLVLLIGLARLRLRAGASLSLSK